MPEKKLKVLVVGGAGYVGSATCAHLVSQGYRVWVLDDLSTGHRSFVLGEGFVHARAGDRDRVRELLRRERFDCVMHFAARALVAESVEKPDEYLENNVEQTRALLEVMLEEDHHTFIFSSSCAVFGNAEVPRIDESQPRKPLNPYGESKRRAEEILTRLAANGLQSVALRYFNAAGADLRHPVGEWHHVETHLIPRILNAARNGAPVEIYGTDYPTPDGTCIRDYIHVSDLAEAHEAAMLRLLRSAKGGRFEAFNLGSANGYSVREVIAACEKEVGKKLVVEEKPRRPGDPPRLVADSSLAARELGFKPRLGLAEIIHSAGEWEKKRAQFRRKAIFLDRDGTLNEDPGYLSDPNQLKVLPKVRHALASLKGAGYLLVVVSNQSGVGRGLIKEGVLEIIHDRLNGMLRPASALIDHFELCFHRPEENCECRKPKPKLIHDAAAKLGIDVSRSYIIGDKASDIGAGRAAGCRGVALVRTGYGATVEKEIKPGDCDFIGDSLLDVAAWILDSENAGS